MKEKDFTKEWVKPYFQGKKKHKNYDKCLDVFFHQDFHASGYFRKPWAAGQQTPPNGNGTAMVNPYFSRLIDQRRPNESETILAYRRNVYKPFSQAPWYTVLCSLQKIFKSEDYFQDYSKTEIPDKLIERDQLEEYCEKNYPYWDSISNWAENIALRWDLVDPNAVCAVFPLNYDKEPNELWNPFSHIIQSRDVYVFVEDEYCVFLSPYCITYLDGRGKERDGKIICVFTKNSIYEARQTSVDGEFDFVEVLRHNIGIMPAFLLKGECITPDGISPFHESFLKPMLPDLDEMAAVSSDCTAELIQHLYSEKWYVMPMTCKDCNGLGNTGEVANGKPIICPTCEGKGVMPHTPYQDLIINPNNALGEKTDIPIPPAGYIAKDTKIMEILLDIKDRHGYSALAAVHMQLLWNSPISKQKESGIAKAYDQSETNNFVHRVAYNLIKNIVNNVYYFVNEMRYSFLIPDKEVREKMLPNIPVPTSFDIVTQQALEDNLNKLNQADVSALIRQMAEIDYLHSRYPDSIVRDKLQLICDCDPFFGKTIEEKLALINCEVIDKVDIALSLYIDSFVNQLLSNDNTFASLPHDKQMETLYKLAQEKVDKLDLAAQLKTKEEVTPDSPPVEAAEVPVKEENQELTPGTKPRKKERNSLTWS